MMRTVRRLASGMSAATKSTPAFSSPSRKCASRDSRSSLAITSLLGSDDAALLSGLLQFGAVGPLAALDIGELADKRPLPAVELGRHSLTLRFKPQSRLFRILRDSTGDLPPHLAIFPDGMTPVVRIHGGESELVMLRWGMPCPPQFGGAPVTNIRNTRSPHWRRWLKPESRCLLPFSSFCEYAETKPRKKLTWFALDGSRGLCSPS